MSTEEPGGCRPDLDLRHVAAFAAVARHGSYTRAARALSFDQSTLTRQVQKLERRLRSQLLDRSSGGVALTEDGRRFLPLADRVLSAASEAAGFSTGGGAAGPRSM